MLLALLIFLLTFCCFDVSVVFTVLTFLSFHVMYSLGVLFWFYVIFPKIGFLKFCSLWLPFFCRFFSFFVDVCLHNTYFYLFDVFAFFLSLIFWFCCFLMFLEYLIILLLFLMNYCCLVRFSIFSTLIFVSPVCVVYFGYIQQLFLLIFTVLISPDIYFFWFQLLFFVHFFILICFNCWLLISFNYFAILRRFFLSSSFHFLFIFLIFHVRSIICLFISFSRLFFVFALIFSPISWHVQLLIDTFETDFTVI